MPAEPTQVFTHMMNLVKGGPPSNMGALDHSAKISSNITFDLPAGRIVHVNSDGEYETGAESWQMAIILRPAATDSDVQNYGGAQWVGGFPEDEQGTSYGYVHSGGFEIETSEFDTALTYAYNEPLRAIKANTDEATGGILTNATIAAVGNATANVCGIVSKPPADNEYGVSMLRYWSVYQPRQ